MITVKYQDSTRFAEFRKTRVGRGIVARTLTKSARSGKVEARKQIRQVWTVEMKYIRLYSTRATKRNLIAEIGASAWSGNKKFRAVPVHFFKFAWKRPKGKKITKATPPMKVELLRGKTSVFKGGFSALGSNSGKKIAIRRKGEASYPTATLFGPSPGGMLMNPAVVEPVLHIIARRVPEIMAQEVNYAMNYEKDRGGDEEEGIEQD